MLLVQMHKNWRFCFPTLSLSLSVLAVIFQVNLGWPVLKQRMMEVVVTTGRHSWKPNIVKMAPVKDTVTVRNIWNGTMFSERDLHLTPMSR